MAVEFVPFTELLSAIVDNRGRTCPVGERGIPLIATNCIDDSRLYPRYESSRFVDEETYQNWFRGHPQPGDILFVCKGSPGRTNWVPDPVDFCIAQDMVAVRADAKKVYPKYLFAALRSDVVQNQIANMHVGTMIPHFKKGDFDKLQIPLVDPKSQRFIGDIYYLLSQKIELNFHNNETLEAMASALFKSWFVDFDDVAESELVESELGLIPKGWRVGALGDVLTLRNERVQPTEATLALPYVPIECIGAKNPFLAEWLDGSEARSSLTLFKRGDILFGAMRPYFHKVCLAPFDGVTRTTVFTFTAKSHEVTAYGLMLAFQAETIEYATLHSEGSTIPYAKWKDSFEKMPIVLPPEPVQEKFGRLVLPLIERADENIQQSRTLAQLRDALLPKLLSGELRIDGVEVG